MLSITVINDSNFDNNPREFKVENWDDFANQLCEKLRDQNGDPINDAEKNIIRSNKSLVLKEGMTIKVSEIIDLRTGNYLSSTTPINLGIGASMVNNAVLDVVSAITGQNINAASMLASTNQGRYYKW